MLRNVLFGVAWTCFIRTLASCETVKMIVLWRYIKKKSLFGCKKYLHSEYKITDLTKRTDVWSVLIFYPWSQCRLHCDTLIDSKHNEQHSVSFTHVVLANCAVAHQPLHFHHGNPTTSITAQSWRLCRNNILHGISRRPVWCVLKWDILCCL